MLILPADLKRCGSCRRWTGKRRPGQAPATVEVDHEEVIGLCQGGPWDGDERRPRAACGRWLPWLAAAPAN